MPQDTTARERQQGGAPRRVTIIPPVFGPAPSPPAAVGPALDLLHTLHVGPRDKRDAAVDSGIEAMRFVLAAVLDESFRPRAYGLSARETHAWLDRVRALLPAEDLGALRRYTATCQAWHTALRAVVADDAADPDWDMTSARGVWPNPAEQRLADALTGARLPVQAQVGVSKYGGRRRGGWFASYWLDCAHRDVRCGLRLDIELDGRAHLYGDHPARDARRDALLRQRGWYIVRLPGSVLHTPGFDQAVGAVAALADQHRRAVVLARSDVGQIMRDLTAETPAAPATQAAPSSAQPTASPCGPPRSTACPRCGQPLVQRTARQGPHAGKPFYGCGAYPQCRYTRSIPSRASIVS